MRGVRAIPALVGPMNSRNRSSIIAVVLAISLLASAPAVLAHEEEGAQWLVSQHEYRNLELTPDSSLPQWSGARMVAVTQSDGVDVNVMSVHNNTYMVVLVERNFNASLSRAGVALDFNMSSMVWAWVAGQQLLVNCHHVKSVASVDGGMLTVVFGRPLAANGSEIGFADGQPFSDFVRVSTWDNGSALGSINLESGPAFGLELLPYIDNYPTAPIAYSAVILAAGLGFVFIETRKYRRGREN